MSSPTTTRTTTRRKRRHPIPSSLCGTGGSPASVYFFPYPYRDSPLSPAKRARSFGTVESIKTQSVAGRRTRGQRHIKTRPARGGGIKHAPSLQDGLNAAAIHEFGSAPASLHSWQGSSAPSERQHTQTVQPQYMPRTARPSQPSPLYPSRPAPPGASAFFTFSTCSRACFAALSRDLRTQTRHTNGSGMIVSG